MQSASHLGADVVIGEDEGNSSSLGGLVRFRETVTLASFTDHALEGIPVRVGVDFTVHHHGGRSPNAELPSTQGVLPRKVFCSTS